MENLHKEKSKLIKVLFVLAILASAYLAVKIVGEVKKNSMLGASDTPATITLSGHGEVMAVPDIASVYFTISKDDKTAKAAQAAVAAIEKQALDILMAKGIEQKDIKTENASVNPKYEYKQEICPQPRMEIMTPDSAVSSPSYYCGGGKQTLVGYTASESITVKVRNTDSAGDIMQALGGAGVSNLSGPNFSIDNEDALQAQARKEAIEDAKMKAKLLAKDLGVRLGKIASFSENGNYPIYYAKDMVMNASAEAAPAPAQLPKGENTVSSDVTITYEIR